MAEVFLTKEGYDKLVEKLNYLQTVVRGEISAKIKAAREFGDLSENAEYDAAKEEQANVEAEIKELNDTIANVTLIDDSKLDSKTVEIGTTVKVQCESTRDKYEFKIVGFTEADCLDGKISNDSPMGKALIGKKKGAVVDVITPGGIAKYKVVNISVQH